MNDEGNAYNLQQQEEDEIEVMPYEKEDVPHPKNFLNSKFETPN